MSDDPIVLGIDPGVKASGWAVLTPREQLAASGTIRPKGHLRGIERHLFLLSRIQDLIAQWHPQVLALEDFVWLTSEKDERYVLGRDAMCKLLGGLEALTLMSPFPVLYEMLPQKWGAQLVGNRKHSKADVARVVNLRLGTAYDGGFYSNHESDSIGIALVALDNIRAQSYRHYFGKSTSMAPRESP